MWLSCNYFLFSIKVTFIKVSYFSNSYHCTKLQNPTLTSGSHLRSLHSHHVNNVHNKEMEVTRWSCQKMCIVCMKFYKLLSPSGNCGLLGCNNVCYWAGYLQGRRAQLTPLVPL